MRRGGREWIIGIILILLADYVFLQNQKIITFDNWWAFFILIPSLGAFADAWSHVREDGGRFTMRARGAIILGVVLLAVAAMFLFNLNWPILGPALLLFGGIAMVVNAFFRK